jgi:hypothetical protein
MFAEPDSTQQAPTDDEYERPPLDAHIAPRWRIQIGPYLYSTEEDYLTAMALEKQTRKGAHAPRRGLKRRQPPER